MLVFFGIVSVLLGIGSFLAALVLLAATGPVSQIIGAILLVVWVLCILIAAVVEAAQRILKALDRSR